ncbi:hypothetical protein CKAH01_07364 [Colletotrichum kahawae]|uniref:Uncharacterized protein n=1 Tax=Colletotrichum kahawae TaxID=34407 RepID=A0AAD9Y5Z9_COLKA|nr:hypothetical protein CKAH01_07364 [Colletotrichum kahawae]
MFPLGGVPVDQLVADEVSQAFGYSTPARAEQRSGVFDNQWHVSPYHFSEFFFRLYEYAPNLSYSPGYSAAAKTFLRLLGVNGVK